MRNLKSIFNALYFAYLFISLLLYIYRDNLAPQLNADFLLRFTDFWVILGFAFFIAVWVIQVIHIGFLKKDIHELEEEVMELKSKLYDFTRIPDVSHSEEPKMTEPGSLEKPGTSTPQ